MNIFGLFATGAAFLRYRKAKKTYEELVERRDTLQASVDAAAREKNNTVNNLLVDQSNSELQNIKVSATLHIKKFDGTLFKASLSVDLTNTGNKAIYIFSMEAAPFLHGFAISFNDKQKIYNDKQLVLAPGSVHSFDVVVNKWGTFADTSKNDRKAEKQYILDLVKEYGKGNNIDGLLTVNINLEWSAQYGLAFKTAHYEQKDGIVIYKS